MEVVRSITLETGEVAEIDSAISLVELERFFSCVQPADDSDCWIWTAHRSGKGYGRFCINGGIFQAHRWIYEKFFGDLGDIKIHVHHTCENPACVNPLHLMAVTIREHAEITRQSRALVDYPISANECIRGHELEGDNLYLPPGSNKRRCRQCRNDFEKKKQAIIRLQVKLMTPFLESTQACLNGHPRTPDSTYMFRGKIFCRECHNEASRTYYERIRKAANEERLRSDSFPANSKFKTHCKRNHDLMDPDNLIRTVTGRRSCRTCALEAMRRRRELNREQMNRRKREAYQKKVREAEDKRLAEQEALDLADKAKKATGSE